MKILVSGFKPFLGQKINPSQKLALDLQSQFNDIEAIILPVEYKQSFLILEREIQNHEPDFVIMLGQAADRKNICFEKIGLNWMQSRNTDEAGFKPESPQTIEKSQVLALMTEFPVDKHYEALKQKNLPVEISFSAGAYVCNDLYFRVLNEFPKLKAVFVHVPLIKEQAEQAGVAFLDYQTQLEVLTELIHSVRRN